HRARRRRPAGAAEDELPPALRNRVRPPAGRAHRGGLPGAGQAPPHLTGQGGRRVTVDLSHYLLLGALLFVCGAVCMATKRNAIGVLMGVELVLNGANINFVAFAHFNPAFEIEGMMFALFVIVL